MTTKKARGKINLLEVSDDEKAKIMERLKQNLRQNIIEAKLLNSLLQCETLTINGHRVFSSEDSLNGLLI